MLAHGVPRAYTEGTWREATDVPGWSPYDWKGDLLTARMHKGLGLTIFGPPGVGKSMIAGLICREAVKLGREVMWEYVATVIDQLQQYDRKASVAMQIRFTHPALLVLDDFGVSTMRDWQITEFDKIVERRYRARRSTIITTNVDPAELARDQAFARIVDRWRQRNTAIQIAGRSRRKQETI